MPVVKLLARFLALVSVRSKEARFATWSEIDLDARTWTIPPDRMKARRAHTVPLSDQAVKILEQLARVRSKGSKFVFANYKCKPLGDSTLRVLFRKLDIGTVHGLRSSFRTWASDTGQDRDVAEHCLAHAVGNETERAYARSTMLERRRVVMQAWADYLG